MITCRKLILALRLIKFDYSTCKNPLSYMLTYSIDINQVFLLWAKGYIYIYIYRERERDRPREREREKEREIDWEKEKEREIDREKERERKR